MAKNKAGRKKNELSQQEREWIENFFERADLIYTTPGRRNTVYVGMDYGKRNTNKKDTFCGKLVIYLVLRTYQRL